MSADATGPRPADKSGEQVPPPLSHRLLRLLAERLRERGTEVREHTHGDEIIELTVTNPRDPDRGGRVAIGYGGHLAWERSVEFKTDSDVIAVSGITLALLGVQPLAEGWRPT